MKPYLCTCGNTLYFENSRCLECQRKVAYDCVGDRMVEISADGHYALCANGVTYQSCNWAVPAASAGALCPSCVLTQVIPDLTLSKNRFLWNRMEQAKRHAIYSLMRLELTVIDRRRDPEGGLAFNFLSSTPEERVLTGHENGVITLDLDEADDAIRETNRTRFHEPYRTLLGHFRHEIGHYYWHLWFEVNASPAILSACREVFGDERADYAEAMKKHYAEGAPAGWEKAFISPYSTMHPWEDWAETWAHYLHICDVLESAKAFGLEQGLKRKEIDLYTPEDARLPAPWRDLDPTPFLVLLHRWIRLSPALNAIARSLGHENLYPFVLSTPVVKKLHVIHACIESPPAPLEESPVPIADPAK